MQRSIPRKQSCFLYSSTMCKPRNVRTNLSFSFRDCHYLLPYMVHKIFACNYSTQDIESCIIFLPLNLTSCYTGETSRKQKDAFSEIFEILLSHKKTLSKLFSHSSNILSILSFCVLCEALPFSYCSLSV